MSWRICRILDFKKDCTSVHALEEIAKVDTARHLAALASKFDEELPQYATVWGYERNFPGFIEDAQQMLESLGVLLEDDEVWGAYDEWHRFMNRWEDVLPTPLWVLIGTVIVDGPGPTVTPKYHPAESLARSMDRGKQMDWQWNFLKTLHETWRTIATEVNQRFVDSGAQPPPFAEIMNTVMTISKSYDEEVKDPKNIEHWYRLTRRDTFHHFGFTHETL
jgi:hypothetical protein